jgi:NADPH-dependent 7-cyano-7-deazaguanine reductase QueF-like protein
MAASAAVSMVAIGEAKVQTDSSNYIKKKRFGLFEL